ncbi:MAG: ATP-dependent helicase [Anaerolineae bacterium]|nr:ATP-dependent helicase [Anaerolineae bacterium]
MKAEDGRPTDKLLRLRPAQERVLAYQGGRMAVSAVPGSGKTFTLSRLAAQLIADGRIDPRTGQEILIVTYLNSSVENFKTAVRKQLLEQGLEPVGYDVRTLHSLSLEIVKLSLSGTAAAMPAVIDDSQSGYFLSQAIDRWIDAFPFAWGEWIASLPADSPQMRVRWREVVERSAKAFIKTAKNERFRPNTILETLTQQPDAEAWQFLLMLTGIYERYQSILNRQGAIDYDDQIWEATDLIDTHPALAERLRERWPYVLEDEAQDSVPLQEILLTALTGPSGNWVRVGDPNQAITSTFTAADPRFFSAFLRQDDVQALPLPNSGRCAPKIIGLANRLVDWVCDDHPVPEVQESTFFRQHIEPTPAGDAQPNPPDSEANIVIKAYKHREDEEIPAVAQLAYRYITKFKDRTAAILVPTNNIGYLVTEALDNIKLPEGRTVPYDSLLRGGAHERQIVAALQSMLALLADPLDRRALLDAFHALRDLEHPAVIGPIDDEKRFDAILQSINRPEAFLFPRDEDEFYSALPTGIASEQDVRRLEGFGRFLQTIFKLRPLPVDDLTLSLGDELFAFNDDVREGDLAIAYQIAGILRSWRDTRPEMRLPDLVAELAAVARGRRSINLSAKSDEGFAPKPGRITLATQHGAKGLEWDAVFLIGSDGYWLPGSLDAYFLGVEEFLGGDPTAEAVAQLHFLMDRVGHTFPGRSPTESAHIGIISERLRLLYVGITRARRFLQISRSRKTGHFNRERDAEPATVMAALYRYLQSQ